jgi:3-polyprenyl-4-hydroxybenzoate decarboxylase
VTLNNSDETKKRDIANHGLRDLQEVIRYLKQEGLLSTVKTPVNQIHEMAGIAKKLEGRNPLLFTKMVPHLAPIFTELY